MFRAALKGVSANKLRLTLTAIAIVIGVMLVSGSFVFSATIQDGFDTLLTDANQGIDVTVRPVQPEFGFEQVTMREDTLDIVLGVDGVAEAEGSVETLAAQVVGDDGDPVGGGQGPPTIGVSWTQSEPMNPMTITSGVDPSGPGEVVLDDTTAERAGVTVGELVTILGVTGAEEFTLVGTARFGEANALLGATLSMFDIETAQSFFGLEGLLSGINIRAAEGVSAADLVTRLTAELPDGVEALTIEDANQEALDDIGQQLNFFNIAVLVFALIAIFVGAFIIYNTFKIIVAQRTRELALLRAVGATARQVTRLVVLEALVVAVIASIVGVVAGILLAFLLGNLFEIPTGNLTIPPSGVIIAMAVGIGVTLASALFPARKAARVPPVAAMSQELARPSRRSTRTRAVVGTVVTLLGVLALAGGLFGEGGIALVGLGALVVFLGVAVLAHLAARPIAAILGWPLPRLFGATGKLAQENTRSQPRRVATTASALMVGIALVVFVAILAESIVESIEQTIFADFPADFTAASTNFQIGMSPAFTDQLRGLDELQTVSAVQAGLAGEVRIDDSNQFLIGVEPDTVEEVWAIGASPASLGGLATIDTVLVQSETIIEKGWAVGDEITVEYAVVGKVPTTIVGTFDVETYGGQPISYMVATGTYRTNINDEFDNRSFALVAEGVTLEEARVVVDAVADDYPNVVVETKSEFVASTEAQINTLLIVVWALLGFTVIIAVLGIINTLALSIYERTREIGLLRAVGMVRRQVWGMISAEAVIISLFGAIMGIGLGIMFGWAVVRSLADEGLGAFDIPWVQLIAVVILSAIAGLFAALYPGWKASRLDVLEAISYE